MEAAAEEKYGFGFKNYFFDHAESAGARVISAAGPIPRHIAFCMDGNRRFARKENLNEGAGHVAGFEAMLRVLLACYRLGVKTVSVYAFSIENFNRSREESDTLFNLVRTKLWGMVKNRDSAMRRLGWHIRFPGHRELLAEDLVERINEIERLTDSCKEMVVNICAPYTTRDDLAHALSLTSQATLEEAQKSSEDFAAKLNGARYMAGSEPLDILVRTSGETRFSDFMCWEAASYCTFEFVPQLWPEFTVWHLYRMIAKWQLRKLVEQRRGQQPLSSLASAPPVVSVSQKGKSKSSTPPQPAVAPHTETVINVEPTELPTESVANKTIPLGTKTLRSQSYNTAPAKPSSSLHHQPSQKRVTSSQHGGLASPEDATELSSRINEDNPGLAADAAEALQHHDEVREEPASDAASLDSRIEAFTLGEPLSESAVASA